METFIESMENPPKRESELRTAVHLAADSIDPGELGRAIDNVYVRRKKCIEHDGARFEYASKRRGNFVVIDKTPKVKK